MKLWLVILFPALQLLRLNEILTLGFILVCSRQCRLLLLKYLCTTARWSSFSTNRMDVLDNSSIDLSNHNLNRIYTWTEQI